MTVGDLTSTGHDADLQVSRVGIDRLGSAGEPAQANHKRTRWRHGTNSGGSHLATPRPSLRPLARHCRTNVRVQHNTFVLCWSRLSELTLLTRVTRRVRLGNAIQRRRGAEEPDLAQSSLNLLIGGQPEATTRP